jgi:DNA-binding transcriptional regulator GbsR (MarR family)
MTQTMVSSEQKILIEKLGVFYEKSGMQPAASRVLALLLVSDNPELTFEEIFEILRISKSAASNAVNLLLNTNKIEYITKPGDRKRYFIIRITEWQQNMKRDMQGWVNLTGLLKQILKQRPGNTIEFNSSLNSFISFLEYLQTEIPIMFANWEKTRLTV